MSEATTKKRDPKQVFTKLANSRVNKALECIELVEKLANKSLYSWTKAQEDTITSALEEATKKVKDAFSNPSAAETKSKFSL